MSPIVLQALLITLYISLVPMVCISLGAGVVAVIQAITQVQEQSLTHLARLVVLAATMYLGAHEAFMQIKQCFLDVLDLIVKM